MGDKTPIKTWSRACQIPPEFVGHTFAYTMGEFLPVFLSWKEWWGTGLESLRQLEHLEVTEE